MRRLFFWGTLLSGVAAAYLMYRRGEPLTRIAQQTANNPVGTLVDEVKAAL